MRSDINRNKDIPAVHGAADATEIASTKATGALCERLVSVRLQNGDNGNAVTKQLPRTMTVAKLRALAARLCKGCYANTLRMTLQSATNEGYVIQLDNDSRQLQFYSIETNDLIRVYS